jgi:hypothetical protein
VSCGRHRAPSCSQCTNVQGQEHGRGFCNGDCTWQNNQCTPTTPVSNFRGCDGPFTAFQKEACNKHNELRARHGAPPLTLRADLCIFAQNWASILARDNPLDNGRPLVHSRGRWGENIYAGGSSRPITELYIDGIAPVCSWYSEIEYYDFTTGTTTNPDEAVGHFTQVVWEETTHFCIGSAVANQPQPKGFFWGYVVASYDKPGNLQGAYLQNVKAPVTTAPANCNQSPGRSLLKITNPLEMDKRMDPNMGLYIVGP